MLFEESQPLSDVARRNVAEIRKRQREDKRIVMAPADVEIALGVKATRVRDMLARGELSSILEGRLRRIFVASVYDHLVRAAIASHPAGGGEAKARPFRGVRPQEKKKPKPKTKVA
jgi:hypothetical protein